MPRPLNTHRAEVHRQHIERRFRTPLNRRHSQSREAVRTLILPRLDQHGARLWRVRGT